MSDITLAPGEIKVLTLVCKHIKTLEVDWESVATEGGYAYAQSARNTWNALKRKKLSGDTPETPKKRKKNGIKEDEAGTTPSPAAKKARKGTKAKPTELEAAAKAEYTSMHGEDNADAGVKEEPIE